MGWFDFVYPCCLDGHFQPRIQEYSLCCDFHVKNYLLIWIVLQEAFVFYWKLLSWQSVLEARTELLKCQRITR